MSDAKPWVKLWTRWYESSSHALLTPEALHTGPNLLVLAGKYGRQEDGSARLVGPHGKPMSISDMAKLTRWSTAKMARILGELRQCGTLDVVANAYSFPRFDRWQESSSANRMRRHRGVTVTDDVTPVCASKREDRGETKDERGEKGGVVSSEIPVAHARQVPEPPTAEARAAERHVENEGLRERLTLTGEVPQPRVKGQSLGNLPTRPNDLRKLLDAGYAFDEIVATAVWLSERITAGEILPAAWSGAFYGGWHDSFRQRECPEKFNAKPKGPRGPVDPSTQRHDVPPEF